MKKFILLLLSLFSLFCISSCKQKRRYSISSKKITINDVELIVPSIKDEIDESLYSHISDYYMSLIDDKSLSNKVSYDLLYTGYINDNYVSFKFDYDKNDKVYYTYDLRSNEQMIFNDYAIINDINKEFKDIISLTINDIGFIEYYINNNKLQVILSSYLIKSNNHLSLPLEESYFVDKEVSYNGHYNMPISLTFDDAPSSKTTKLVDLLNNLGIRCTFFILGEKVEYYKDELLYIYLNNHEIGNHSYSHPNFLTISKEEGLKEISNTQEAIYKVIKHFPRVFRFPYGIVNKELMKDNLLPTVLWDIDSEDWRRPASSKLFNNVMQDVSSGSVILFHDFKYINYDVITSIVNTLKSKGYTFVTVSELFEFTSEQKLLTNKVLYNK